MTETEVIATCRRTACLRRRSLGPIRLVQLIDKDSISAESHSQLDPGHDKWLVVFQGPPGFDTDDRFWVDDSTGRVVWGNGPPSWYFLMIAIPMWLAVAPVSYISNHLYNAWHYLRLPRCPHCRRRLRTRLARQCEWCGEEWHNAKGT